MKHVIIVAGGKGVRMGNSIPKQFMLLANKPILMHTIERFYSFDNNIDIIVVLPKEQQQYWKHLCKEHNFNIEHRIVDGGQTRFHSSQNAIKSIEADDNDVVAIHDGVRPLVSINTIKKCFDEAQQKKAVIPVTNVIETLRYINSNGEDKTVDRSKYKLVQTPQVFELGLLKRAYNEPFSETFTDDASVVENIGTRVFCVEGNRENIKLTTPFDLLVANAIVESKNKK